MDNAKSLRHNVWEAACRKDKVLVCRKYLNYKVCDYQYFIHTGNVWKLLLRTATRKSHKLQIKAVHNAAITRTVKVWNDGWEIIVWNIWNKIMQQMCNSIYYQCRNVNNRFSLGFAPILIFITVQVAFTPWTGVEDISIENCSYGL